MTLIILSHVYVCERGDHYELHFPDRVEFWNLKGGKIGESKVHTVEAKETKGEQKTNEV